MSTTITIRAEEELRQALEERARAQGTTVSEVARSILRDALDSRPLGQRTGHLRGQLTVANVGVSWSDRIKDRNWRK